MRVEKLRRLQERMEGLAGVRDSLRRELDMIYEAIMQKEKDQRQAVMYRQEVDQVAGEIAKLKVRLNKVNERMTEVGHGYGLLKELFERSLEYAINRGAVTEEDFDLLGNASGQFPAFGQNSMRAVS